MIKHILALAVAAAVASPAHALTAGALAFTPLNAAVDNGAVAARVDIAARTTVFFSDNEWNGTAFADTNEHTLTWSTGAGVIAAGTVVSFTEIDATTDTITASIGTLALASGGGTNLGLSASGDTFYAYLGTGALAPTTFLTALTSEATTTNVTNAGLTVGTNAIALVSSADFGEYTAARSGATTFADYKPALFDNTNWNDVATGDFSASVPNTTAFTLSPIPEPQTYAMMLAGLMAMGFVASRRNMS